MTKKLVCLGSEATVAMEEMHFLMEGFVVWVWEVLVVMEEIRALSARVVLTLHLLVPMTKGLMLRVVGDTCGCGRDARGDGEYVSSRSACQGC